MNRFMVAGFVALIAACTLFANATAGLVTQTKPVTALTVDEYLVTIPVLGSLKASNIVKGQWSSSFITKDDTQLINLVHNSDDCPTIIQIDLSDSKMLSQTPLCGIEKGGYKGITSTNDPFIAFVVNYDDDEIYLFDLKSKKILAKYDVEGNGTSSYAVSPNKPEFVTYTEFEGISYYNLLTGKLIKKLSIESELSTANCRLDGYIRYENNLILVNGICRNINFDRKCGNIGRPISVSISETSVVINQLNPMGTTTIDPEKEGCRYPDVIFNIGENRFITSETAISVDSRGRRLDEDDSYAGYLYTGSNGSKQIYPPIIRASGYLESVATNKDGSLIAFYLRRPSSAKVASIFVARSDGTTIGSWTLDVADNNFLPSRLRFTPDGRGIVAAGVIYTTLNARGITQASLTARASAPTLAASLAKVDGLCGTGALSLSQCLRIREIVLKDQIATYPELAAWLEGVITDAEFVRRWKARG